MIHFSLPDFTAHLPYNLFFHHLQRTAPELFFEDVEIDSIYGCFPGCIMNGGRIIFGNRYSYDQIASTFDQIANEGLTTRLTFTNMFISSEQFDDEYSNDILKAAQGRNAEVIVYSDELDDYITGRYHLKRTLSTTRVLSGAEELNDMLKRYDMVVLDYNRNKDDLFLRRVYDPTRLEVMPNELCEPGCPIRQKHYEHNSRCQLEGRAFPFGCNRRCETAGFTTRTRESATLLGNDDIRRLNRDYGIHHFKIVGRTLTRPFNLEPYLYYFVHPEYHSVVLKLFRKRFVISSEAGAY